MPSDSPIHFRVQQEWRCDHDGSGGVVAGVTQHASSVLLNRVEAGDQPAAIDLVQRHSHTGGTAGRSSVAYGDRLVDEDQRYRMGRRG